MSKRYDFDAKDAIEGVGWWYKHRRKVYGIILLISGLLGGNVDRISDALIPAAGDTEEVDTRLNDLENYVKSHEQSHKELLESIKVFSAHVEALKKRYNDTSNTP